MELKAALQEKDASLNTTEKVITEFEQLGYLNDAEWLESFLRRMQREKKGSQYTDCKDNEVQSIERLLATRYRQKNLAAAKERQKVIASLARKGFTLGNILKTLVEK